ncbi:Uncharacterized conserved protein [Janthinobacterium sp. Marseille]|uniref:His-Xaa-Ser system radical SAM maturase HxsB n=1 Tax=Herminiimonas aquatilis TaxID=345342 RepID=A0ABW2JA64_9BURK|nr:His-Xaa-Ser system radical SAM maturase HxsB [Janthinobacterium sp. Marseille]ABR91718.1 Uncharacterized conserved protein [Janthinobacterium sp. Marseille]
MSYQSIPLPFLTREISDELMIAISESGDHIFTSVDEVRQIRKHPSSLSHERQAFLRARFFIKSVDQSPGMRRLLISRRAARRTTTQDGPSLHIIVPTLQCAHSCKYCQVSRSLNDEGHTIKIEDLDAACESIFESSSPTLTVEFQGGDPLLRFDLVRRAILYITSLNKSQNRRIRYVVASTLHQLNVEMCLFFKEHKVYLSTSIDGPSRLHNKNRPTPTRDAFERTLQGVALAQKIIGPDAVSALMTTTKESLLYPNEIVDEYVRLGFKEIFLRPLSAYGFAKRNQKFLAYTLEDFNQFYLSALERVLYWNQQGVELREVYTSIILNKLLSTFDSGYVDLQSPTGAGLSTLVYNYDGFVYPSDEARMIAETGDQSLRLGRIGEAIASLLSSDIQKNLINASLVDLVPGCKECAYNQFCAPNPVDSQAQFGTPFAPVHLTEHCRRHMWLFDYVFSIVKNADDDLLDLFCRWAEPVVDKEIL